MHLLERSGVTVQKGSRLLAVAGPLLLMLLLAWTPGISFTEDLGRHLLLGHIISEQHVVPKTNYLTYTHPDFPFVNHHWLSEVVLYQLHRVGGFNGLIVFKMLIMTGALALALLTVVPRRGAGLYWIVGLLAAVMMGFRSHVRPELFTFLGVAFYGWCMERMRRGARWPRWAMVAAAWFWANAHIYFVFGLGMAAAFVLERWKRHRVHSVLYRDLAWLAGLVVVSCLNPNGVRGLLYPFRIFSNYEIGITENASPLDYWRTVVNPMLLALPVATVLLVAAVGGSFLRKRRSGGAEPAVRPAAQWIALASLAMTWTMARSVPLLALTAPVVIAGWLNPPGADGAEPAAAGRWPRPGALAGAGIALVLNVFLVWAVVQGAYSRVFPSPIGPTPFGFDDERRYTALRQLKEEGLPPRVFSDYNIGSLVEYDLYPEPGYVDNRPEAFPGSFWRAEYTPALALGEEWETVRRARGINTIIVSLPGVKEQYTQELMRRPEWVLVHLDALTGVWTLDAPGNVSFLEAHAFGPRRLEAYELSVAERLNALRRQAFCRRQVEADRLVYELYSLVCIGQSLRAWPYIWKLRSVYPDYQVVHEILRVTAPPDRREQVWAVLAARARWPVAAKQVLDWGRVLQTQGRFDEARKVYRRGRLFFPLSRELEHALDGLADLEYRAGEL